MPNVDMVNFMMTMMGRMMQEQSAVNLLENELPLAVQAVLQKDGHFNNEYITKFMESYEYEMVSKGAAELHMVTQLNTVITIEMRDKVLG